MNANVTLFLAGVSISSLTCFFVLSYGDTMSVLCLRLVLLSLNGMTKNK